MSWACAYLARRWTEGCDKAQALRDEIAAHDCQGCRKSVRRFRNTLPHPTVHDRYPPPPAVANVVRWITSRPENQRDQARQDLSDVCGRCPEIAEARRLARGFTNELRKDLAAVTAGLTLLLGSGAVEGNVTRIKLLKCQHCGRAGFDPHGRRVLLAH